MESLDLMTMTTIKNTCKDQERIKVREFLYTQDDSLASTREWEEGVNVQMMFY